MPTNPADEITDALIDRARDGFDEIGADLAERLRKKIDVAVGRSGGVVVRSLPGEPPRRDTGDYQATVRHETRTEGNTVTTAAGTDSQLGPWLEGGTSRMKPRPHFKPVREEFAAEAVERVKQALSNKQE